MKKVVAVVSIFVMMAVVGCSSSRDSLDGAWAGESEDGFAFEARVANNTLEIDLIGADGTKALYWLGTFEFDEISDGDELYSSADVEALSTSLFGAQSEGKEFLYSDDGINFDFEIMGSSREVKLEEQ